jgi:hypothetical protein
MRFTLLRRRRVNPSTTATGVGPNNLWGREAIRAVGTEGIGIVAAAALGAPISPGILAVAMTPPHCFDVSI